MQPERHVRLFRNGRNQAVRIPRDFEMDGNALLFNRVDGVEAAWRVVGPILGTATPVIEYEPGTWGPKEADDLIGKHGGWINPNPNKPELKIED